MENFYCDYQETSVSEEECLDCEYRENCNEDEKIENIKDSPMKDIELFKVAKSQIQKMFNLPDDKIDYYIKNLCENALRLSKETFEKNIHIILKKYIEDAIKEKINIHLENTFNKVLDETVLIYNKNEQMLKTTIQDIITKRISEFIATKNSYSNSDINTRIDYAIKERVEQKTKECIEEIKKETIEKFNKEIMKKMMYGMANELGKDKRLIEMMSL